MEYTQINDLLLEVNTSYPAFIVDFNAERQTATVQLAIEKIFSNLEQNYVAVEYPLLKDVQVHFPQCGSYCITFPVKAGDGCLVIFSQRGIDHWKLRGEKKAGLTSKGLPSPVHRRFLSMSDSVAIVGFNPIPNAITNFSTNSMDIKSKTSEQFISLKEDGTIHIKNPDSLLLECPENNINGNVKIDGNLHVTGKVTFDSTLDVASTTIADGINIKTHMHPYTWTASGGAANTSPPLP